MQFFRGKSYVGVAFWTDLRYAEVPEDQKAKATENIGLLTRTGITLNGVDGAYLLLYHCSLSEFVTVKLIHYCILIKSPIYTAHTKWVWENCTLRLSEEIHRYLSANIETQSLVFIVVPETDKLEPGI